MRGVHVCEQREGTRYCPAQLHGQCTQRALTGGRSQSLAGEGQRAGNRATHNAWPSCWSALPRPAMLRGNKPCTRPVARSYGRRGWRESPPVQVQGVCRQPRADGCRRPPAGALARFVPLRDRGALERRIAELRRPVEPRLVFSSWHSPCLIHRSPPPTRGFPLSRSRRAPRSLSPPSTSRRQASESGEDPRCSRVDGTSPTRYQHRLLARGQCGQIRLALSKPRCKRAP